MSEHKEAFVWIDPTTIKIKQNPRGMTNKGFSIEEMGKLRESIRVNGHKLPLEIRYIEGVPNLIAGERRWRSIMSLIQSNAECFNRRTGKMEPASQVYATVCCFETACENDSEAMVAAIQENILHSALSDHEILLQCQILEESGMTRQELATSLNLSEAWISQTFSLLNPEKCSPRVLEAMADGILGRTQAIQFLNYPLDQANEILDRAIERWKAQEAQKEIDAVKQHQALIEGWDILENALTEAVESGDTEAAAKARRELVATENKMEEVGKLVDKVKKSKKKKPKPSMEQIQEAAKDSTSETTAQRHMPMKTLRQYADKIEKMLAQPEDFEFFNPENGETISRREIQIVLNVCNCVLSRNTLRTPLEAIYFEDEAVAAK